MARTLVALVTGASRGIGRAIATRLAGRRSWAARCRWSSTTPLPPGAEAALALCTGPPTELTRRVTTSLRLLVDLDRPVRTLDGQALVEGWQPGDIDPRRIPADDLHAFHR